MDTDNPTPPRPSLRIVGFLCCRKCDGELGTVYADKHNMTLLRWEGLAMRQAVIVCRCGGVRTFKSVTVRGEIEPRNIVSTTE